MRKEEPVPVAPGSPGRTGDSEASAASLETTPDPDQNQTPGVLRYRPASPPAHGALRRRGYERPTRTEKVSDVLAILFPRNHKHIDRKLCRE
ncbi:hypothetical protein EPR50_G00159200 [Perca flavescens]|uniref:Uncharacterized protein n=1 Tax=Perca flavescens TaxID=8167 RepID=A0A484CGY9_PERFV|nr:hypothetical protein EPR50_G00159200 [Perca flavescens]